MHRSCFQKIDVLLQFSYLGQEDSLEKEIATHSSILAWGNSMDRGAWLATVHGGGKETQLSN